jgi:hypothetical protein
MTLRPIIVQHWTTLLRIRTKRLRLCSGVASLITPKASID